MKITWLGHSCFKIEENGYSVITDPYSAGSVPGYGALQEEADCVLCSHGHGDHCAEGEIKKRTGGVCPFEFEFIDTFHDDQKGALRGTNRITILKAGGLKLIHMGDIGCDLTDEQYEKLQGADVLLIPVGGFFTVEPDLAKKMADRIGAVVTVPMHFRTPEFGYPKIGTLDAYTKYCDDVKTYGNSLEITKGMEKQTAVLTPVYGGKA